MGEAVDTIPSILNKCLFVSPDKPKAICSPLFQSWGHNDDPGLTLSYFTAMSKFELIVGIESR